MRFFLLLFIVIPIVEMWLLIQVGGLIGALPTIALVMLTAVIGLALLRRQGFATLMRGRAKMESGEVPAMEMIEALILAVSGAMLLTPGFFTDALGFAGLLPMSRHWLVNRLVGRMDIVDGYYQSSNIHTHTIHSSTGHSNTGHSSATESSTTSGGPFEGSAFDNQKGGEGSPESREPLEGEYRRED